MDWLRLWHDMPNDPKWGTIARKCGEPISLVIATYIHILVDASRNVTRGHVTVTVEDLATALNVTDEQISNVLAAMEGRVIEDGLLLGWSKRQPKREDSGNPETGAKSAAQRQAEARERKRLAKIAAESKTPVTPSHDESRNVTTEKRREEEIREEEKKTQDSASVTQLAGAACMAMKAAGVSSVNPSHPKLISLVDKGISAKQFADAAAIAVDRGKGFAYVLGIVEGQIADSLAPIKTRAPQAQPESFRERDDRLARERIEAICPSIAAKAPRSRNVIAITGTLTETIGAIA
jgi:hypothetical protein